MSEDALRIAQEKAKGRDPFEIADSACIVYKGTSSEGVFEVPFLGTEVHISFPEFEVIPEGSQMPPHIAALLVYHLGMSDGTPAEGRWLSFAELPDGEFYVQAFRGYTAQVIVRRFADDVDGLEAAAFSLGAHEIPDMADRAWRVPLLPRIPVALLWWNGDDEFGPRADILFDSSASRHLPIDGCAILGSWLTAALGRQAG